MGTTYRREVAIETLTTALREKMKTMNDEERLELMNTLMEGYCKICGCKSPTGSCSCWKDE